MSGHPNGYCPSIDRTLPNFIRLEALKRALSVGRGSSPFWLAPLLALVVGLALGSLLSRPTNVEAGWTSALLYDGGADAARSFVQLTATSLATVTTLTLTLTVISIQLASSQYSPRLIEHYLDDPWTRSVYSLFLGTFAFAISTLLNIRLPSGDEEVGLVPNVAISVLVALLVCCLGALVFFVHRVTTSMRVEAILRRVRDRTFGGVDRRAQTDGERTSSMPRPPADARPVRSRRSGYYAAIDWDAVAAFERDQPTRIWVVVVEGDFVSAGTPVALVEGDLDDDLADAIESWLQFDEERWVEREVAYGVRNLVDVALKALSPGLNDPTTATTAIERVGETLARATADRAARIVTTAAGTDVIVAQRDWANTLHAAVRQIVEYGGHDVEVVLALVRMLTGLAWADADVDRRDEISDVAGHLRTWIGPMGERHASDGERIDREFERLAGALRHEVVLGDGRHL